jgi:hypothetical protein
MKCVTIYIMSKSKCGLIHWLTKFKKTSTQKGMAGWLIKKGIAKSKGTANLFLLLVSFIFFAMSKIVYIII